MDPAMNTMKILIALALLWAMISIIGITMGVAMRIDKPDSEEGIRWIMISIGMLMLEVIIVLGCS